VLVVDDKSTIPAAQVLSTEPDPRLRVIVNTGPKGAASTRNLGVAVAAGDVVFFLDDDEILPDYCVRVLSSGGPASLAEWGFSSTLECRERPVGDVLRQRKQLARGLVPRQAPVREAVAATSGGFWIHKSGFIEAGGLDADQSIDEDTDLCMRLLALGSRPWYEEQPGVRLYQGYAPARPDGAQLTAATPADCALRCYRRTHDRNASRFPTHSAYRWFLATRYLRRAVKGGQRREAWLFVNEQASWWISACLKFYFCIKWLRHT
jgi:glycosyltransferase involved in cell wall biosynthesis